MTVAAGYFESAYQACAKAWSRKKAGKIPKQVASDRCVWDKRMELLPDGWFTYAEMAQRAGASREASYNYVAAHPERFLVKRGYPVRLKRK